MQKNSPLFGAPAGKRFLAVSVTAALALTGVAFGVGSASAVPAPTATSATPDLSKVSTWEQADGDHYDHEGTTLPGTSTKALRISNWVDDAVNYGGQEQLMSPPIASAGPRVSGGASYDTFTANFTLSAASYATQPDLSVEVSPNTGSNRAGGNLLIREEAGQKLTLTNFHLKPGATTDDNSSWTSSTATIDFTKPVAVKYVAQFDPTASADVVKVYLDGSATPALVGSTFETYAAISGNPAQTVNSLLFRAVDRQVGTTDPDAPWTIHEPTADEFTALKGKGFYFSAIKYAVTNTAAATPISFAVPTIDGTAAVGETLNAVTDTDAVTDVNFAYKWLRDGKAISGATASSYTLTAADHAKQISVTVTASKPGYTTSTRTSAPTADVLLGQFDVTSTPITGNLTVGSKVQSHITTSPAAAYTYVWKADGVAVSGATKSYHTITLSDLGHELTVTVVAKKTQYKSISVTSAPTAEIALGTLTVGTPSLTGTAKVGSTLTASVTATKGALLRYGFYSDGDLVQLSTSTQLLVTWDLSGTPVTVRVVAVKEGYVSTTSAFSAAKNIA